MIDSSNPSDAPPPVPATLSQNQTVVRAAAVLAAGNVASRLLGLARETVKANLFGTSGLLSAFTVAAYVPMSLFELIIGGMVSSSLVPVFSEYAQKERREELWGVVSTFLSVATVALLLVLLLVELFAPQVAWLIGARNFSDPQLTAVTVRLLRLAAPAVLFLSLASILTGVLYSLNRFSLPAFTAAAFNGAIVVVALAFPARIESLVWGLLAGSLLQMVIQLPALQDARLRWSLDWRHPAIRRILLLYLPIVAGLVVNQLAVALSYNLATRTGDESITYMSYATTLYQFPLGLVVTALSIATLPTLSQQASGDLTSFRRTLASGIRLVLTLILPATAGLLALAGPIVAVLFEHGRFTPLDTQVTALVLRIYLFGLPFAAVDQMLVFASYARKDTWRPALVGVISIVIYLGVAVALLRPLESLPAGACAWLQQSLAGPALAEAGPTCQLKAGQSLGLLSLMVADSVKHVVHTLLMLWLLRRHVGSLGWRRFGAGRSLLAGLLTGLAALAAARLAAAALSDAAYGPKFLILAAGGLAGMAAYGLAVAALDIQEAKGLLAMLRRPRPGA